jgi:hypothetical protein
MLKSNVVPKFQKVELNVGSMVNQCPSCGEKFHSISSFDSHRYGPYENKGRKCLTSTEMSTAGLHLNSVGNWGREFKSAVSP